jgi:hypothetical protein
VPELGFIEVLKKSSSYTFRCFSLYPFVFITFHSYPPPFLVTYNQSILCCERIHTLVLIDGEGVGLFLQICKNN